MANISDVGIDYNVKGFTARTGKWILIEQGAWKRVE
jgi:hypothetical protein